MTEVMNRKISRLKMDFNRTFVQNKDHMKELIRRLPTNDVIQLCHTNSETCGNPKIWEDLLREDFGCDVRSLYLLMRNFHDEKPMEQWAYLWLVPRNRDEIPWFDTNEIGIAKYSELFEELKDETGNKFAIASIYGMEYVFYDESAVYPATEQLKEFVRNRPGKPFKTKIPKYMSFRRSKSFNRNKTK